MDSWAVWHTEGRKVGHMLDPNMLPQLEVIVSWNSSSFSDFIAIKKQLLYIWPLPQLIYPKFVINYTTESNCKKIKKFLQFCLSKMRKNKKTSLPHSEHSYYTDKAIFVFSSLPWKTDVMKIEQPEDTVISITSYGLLYFIYFSCCTVLKFN